MIILGLDISLTNTGFCIVDLNDEGGISIVKMGSTNTKKEKSRGRKLKLIYEQMNYLKDVYTPDMVVAERLFSFRVKTTQALFSAMGVIQCALYEHEFILYSPATIKKDIAGHGGASKEDVQEVLLKMFPSIKFTNDDESDALGVVITHLKKEGLFNGS